MTSELETLRSLADRVHPPSFEVLEEVARRRTRRAAAVATVGGVVAVVATVVGIALATAGDDRSAPEPVIPPTPTATVTSSPTPSPTPTPTPTHRSDASMTPAEVVAAEDAVLLTTGVSVDDPAFRVSVWQAVCHWCPRGEVTPYYSALAITTDGYATAVYRRSPFEGTGEHAVSVGPGLLAFVDGNQREWLVRDDGTITELARDYDEVAAADPRLWVGCVGDPPGEDPDIQDGVPSGLDPQPTWCAIDPGANAIHVWLGPWVRTADDSESEVSPGTGGGAWGVRSPSYGPGRPAPEVDRAEVWWEADGSRRREDLGPATSSGPVSNGPSGLMSCWSWVKGSPTISLFTSTDRGATWDTATIALPFPPDNYGGFTLSWTPGGDLVGRRGTRRGGVELWRAAPVDGGSFELVADAERVSQFGWVDLPVVVNGSTLLASWLWSDDDGRTWSVITPWRP
jgi:hypothetical protein